MFRIIPTVVAAAFAIPANHAAAADQVLDEECACFSAHLKGKTTTRDRVAFMNEEVIRKIVAKKEAELVEAKECRDFLVNQRNFEGWSSFVGVGVLEKPGPDGRNDTVNLLGLQLIWPTNDQKTIGLGGFVAINSSNAPSLEMMDGTSRGTADGATMDDPDFDYIGAGFVLSGRFEGSAPQFNLGVGYMIDRVGFVDDAGVRGDRSGLFFSLSFNFLSSGLPIQRSVASALGR